MCCSPGTGQKLRYGKAMQARASQVELPSVAALFADISSKGPERQRRWSPRTPGTPRVRHKTSSSRGQVISANLLDLQHWQCGRWVAGSSVTLLHTLQLHDVWQYTHWCDSVLSSCCRAFMSHWHYKTQLMLS